MTTIHLPRYRGSLSDSARWSAVDLRAGDVVVSTPPKSGTTWTLAMAYLALHGPDASFDRLSSVAPWVDFHGGDPHAPTPHAQSTGGRRLFKTHTPPDGLPLVNGVVVITVYREPGESFLSMRRHLRNMTAPPPDHPNRGPLETAFDAFLSRPFDRARFEGVTLSALHHHLRCSEAVSALMLHYADMSANPLTALRTIADCIGVDLAPNVEKAVLDATGKDAMRKDAGHFAPEANTGFFRNDAHFFSRSDQHAEHLTGAQEARLFKTVRTELGQRSAAWFCRSKPE